MYVADPPGARTAVMLDGLLAVYHEPSGATHLLAPPAPEILDALASGPADAAVLLDRLAARHDIDAGDHASSGQIALNARLAELEASGLVRNA